MDNIIELDNNKYGLAINSFVNDKEIDYINLKDTHINFNNKKNILFCIDLNEHVNYNHALNKIQKLIKNKNNLGILIDEIKIIGLLKNYNKDNEKHNALIYAINALLINDYKERYEYVYDKICEYLDNEFTAKNLCDFKNDKCIAKRDTDCTMGCCHQFKSIFSYKKNTCKFLVNKTCSTHCLACKLFTCDYLEKNGIKYRIKDILLADYFFNIAQKLVIKTKLFTSKEDIIKLIYFFHI